MAGQQSAEDDRERPRLPIEAGFPIERVNEIAAKESRAKQYYRPVYTMHKWWARRPGCLFRAISLYSLLDEDTDPADVSVYEPGENQTLGANGPAAADVIDAIGATSIEDPIPALGGRRDPALSWPPRSRSAGRPRVSQTALCG